MKFRRLMAASMAGVMAVSSSIVCQVTASAAEAVVLTNKTIAAWGNVDVNLEAKGKPADGATVTFTIEAQNMEWVGQEIFNLVSNDWGKKYQEIKHTSEPQSQTEYTFPISDFGGATSLKFQAGQKTVVLKKVTVSDVIPEAYPGTKVSLAYNQNGSNYQGEYSLGGLNDVSTATELFEKASKVEVKFQVNGATSNGADFDISKIDFKLVPKIYYSSGEINSWPWTTVGTTSYDEATKMVTVSAVITKELFTGNEEVKENGIENYLFSNLVLVPMVNTTDASAQVDLFIEDPIVDVSSNSVDSVKITAADSSAVNTEVTFGDEITLKADVTPADADGADKVEWSSNDPDAAEVTDGKVSFKKAGKVVITAKAGGKSDSVTFNVAKKKFTYNGGWNNVTVDGTKDLDTLLKAETDSFNIIPASSPYVDLKNGKDYTASAQVAADKKSYDLTVKLIGDAADNYELTNPTFKGGYIYYHMSSMALNKTSLNLIAGGKGEALTAVTTPDNALLDDLKITYESSDPTVATVDSDGNVTPVKAGTATIKVTATANAIVGQAVDHVVTKTAECQVTVTDVAIPATKIHLDAKEKILTVGDKAKLTATVTPADSTDSVTWESSDPTVAAVDNDGNVTAKAAGTATITATAGEYSSECTVTVKAKEPDIVPDDNTYSSIPKTSTKIDSVATTINSDGTRNMLAVFYISDEDVKACDLLAVTIQRQDGKEFSKKLYLENYFDSISYTNGDKIYQGSANGSNHYVAMKFLNVDPEWGSITIKIEPIIAKG